MERIIFNYGREQASIGIDAASIGVAWFTAFYPAYRPIISSLSGMQPDKN